MPPASKVTNHRVYQSFWLICASPHFHAEDVGNLQPHHFFPPNLKGVLMSSLRFKAELDLLILGSNDDRVLRQDDHSLSSQPASRPKEVPIWPAFKEN